MTTAPENRGGYRPTAPQNNPANISATGGNGQSGATQALKPMTGQAWGTNQANEDIGRAAPLAGNPTAMSASPLTASIQPIIDLNAPTEFPDQPVTAGNDGSMQYAPPMATPQPEQTMQFIQALYMQDPTNQDLRYILETAANQGRI